MVGQPDPMPTQTEDVVNTTELYGLRMGEAISRREIRVLVPGKRGKDGGGTDQTTDVDHSTLWFIKHHGLWSDSYHNPYFREGRSFCSILQMR